MSETRSWSRAVHESDAKCIFNGSNATRTVQKPEPGFKVGKDTRDVAIRIIANRGEAAVSQAFPVIVQLGPKGLQNVSLQRELGFLEPFVDNLFSGSL